MNRFHKKGREGDSGEYTHRDSLIRLAIGVRLGLGGVSAKLYIFYPEV